MNRRQKAIIQNFISVSIGTTVFILVMINVKDIVNKSEAMRAMELLGKSVQEYRKKYHSTPPESYIVRQKEDLRAVRLGELKYRAQWVEFGAEPDTILGYSRKNYISFVEKGYIVLRLSGRVEWMKKKEFEKLLKEQQTQAEIELLRESSKF